MNDGKSPLAGRTILLTRERNASRQMAELIAARGGEALIAPVMKFAPAPLSAAALNCIRGVNGFDWIVLTSANGVRYFFDVLSAQRLEIVGPKFAVVGQKTAEALERRGIKPDLIPDDFTAEKLADRMAAQQEKGQVLLALGTLAKDDLERRLREAGYEVARVDVYQTVLNEAAKPIVQTVVAEAAVDAVVFASPSAIRFFMSMADGLDQRAFWRRAAVACIGPVTADAARAHGLTPSIVPATYTAHALIQGVEQYFSGQRV
ncbi:uroporphyrinogen-III synthase [Caenibacillus caldisaponilyticus]|uniref:uroporphyrinogen-III synthase n=1 Tax=Caenibacillus caldisaponilyticus TaxID=1674942 RepID=UPI001177CED6|nr:uroporphyrinogen-III synthase [Caenibacillus caldisaponilyticus]